MESLYEAYQNIYYTEEVFISDLSDICTEYFFESQDDSNYFVDQLIEQDLLEEFLFDLAEELDVDITHCLQEGVADKALKLVINALSSGGRLKALGSSGTALGKSGNIVRGGAASTTVRSARASARSTAAAPADEAGRYLRLQKELERNRLANAYSASTRRQLGAAVPTKPGTITRGGVTLPTSPAPGALPTRPGIVPNAGNSPLMIRSARANARASMPSSPMPDRYLTALQSKRAARGLPPAGGTSAGSSRATTQRAVLAGWERDRNARRTAQNAVDQAATVARAFLKSLKQGNARDKLRTAAAGKVGDTVRIGQPGAPRTSNTVDDIVDFNKKYGGGLIGTRDIPQLSPRAPKPQWGPGAAKPDAPRQPRPRRADNSPAPEPAWGPNANPQPRRSANAAPTIDPFDFGKKQTVSPSSQTPRVTNSNQGGGSGSYTPFKYTPKGGRGPFRAVDNTGLPGRDPTIERLSNQAAGYGSRVRSSGGGNGRRTAAAAAALAAATTGGILAGSQMKKNSTPKRKGHSGINHYNTKDPSGKIRDRLAVGEAQIGDTFQDAFRHWRKKLGPGKEFTYAGKRFTTDLSQEEIYYGIADHLINEGYAVDEKSAYQLIEAMSDEWLVSILDEGIDLGVAASELASRILSTPGESEKSIKSDAARMRRSLVNVGRRIVNPLAPLVQVSPETNDAMTQKRRPQTALQRRVAAGTVNK